MDDSLHSTCWQTIDEAAKGDPGASERFAARYGPPIRAYLVARWRGTSFVQEVEDTVQGVLYECFKSGGVLEKADRDRAGGFRAFLYGVTRKIALRAEEKRARGRGRELPLASGSGHEPPEEEESLHATFDRAWAQAVMSEAAEMLSRHPRTSARAELLRARFHEGRPLKDLAKEWGKSPEALYREFARARLDFQRALLNVVAGQIPGASSEEIEAECRALLGKLE